MIPRFDVVGTVCDSSGGGFGTGPGKTCLRLALSDPVPGPAGDGSGTGLGGERRRSAVPGELSRGGGDRSGIALGGERWRSSSRRPPSGARDDRPGFRNERRARPIASVRGRSRVVSARGRWSVRLTGAPGGPSDGGCGAGPGSKCWRLALSDPIPDPAGDGSGTGLGGRCLRFALADVVPGSGRGCSTDRFGGRKRFWGAAGCTSCTDGRRDAGVVYGVVYGTVRPTLATGVYTVWEVRGSCGNGPRSSAWGLSANSSA